MRFARSLIGAACLAAAAAAQAGNALSDMHPEESYPAPAAAPAAADPYAELFKQVQEKLNGLGFDAGPASGRFDSKTQAALVQFQLAETLPASGSLDAQTLAALGVQAAEPQSGEGTPEGGAEPPPAEQAS